MIAEGEAAGQREDFVLRKRMPPFEQLQQRHGVRSRADAAERLGCLDLAVEPQAAEHQDAHRGALPGELVGRLRPQGGQPRVDLRRVAAVRHSSLLR